LRLVRQNGDVAMLPSKVPHMPIRAGDKFVCVGPAGGGYGDPLARDPSRVRDDVVDGLISPEMAREDYGIAVGTNGKIDAPATARLRREMMSRPGTSGE
jgi:N-methylhydantoinase B